MMRVSEAVAGPHRGIAVAHRGAPLERADTAAVLIHGRGAAAEDILSLAEYLGGGEIAFLAPQAAGRTWYPASFLAPLEVNQPALGSALEALEDLFRQLSEAGIPAERTLLLGFSQGACLALEFAAGRPRRFGGVVGFTGGLIGPPDAPRDERGGLAGTPVFLGAGDPDPHVPWSRVEESADVLERLGAEVVLRRYPGLGHGIHEDELGAARGMLKSLQRRSASA